MYGGVLSVYNQAKSFLPHPSSMLEEGGLVVMQRVKTAGQPDIQSWPVER